jgi:hypothetical protein
MHLTIYSLVLYTITINRFHGLFCEVSVLQSKTGYHVRFVTKDRSDYDLNVTTVKPLITDTLINEHLQ